MNDRSHPRNNPAGMLVAFAIALALVALVGLFT
jgi:cytochrome b